VSQVNGSNAVAPASSDGRWEATETSAWVQYLLAAVVVLGVTLPLLFLRPVLGPRPIALIYLLVVVLMALFVGRGPTLLAATMSALLWDFCFLPPVATFFIDNVEDGILFGMYFVVALVLGQLTARIRAQEKARRQGEERATALYELTRELAAAVTLDQLLERVVRHLERTFDAKVAVLLPDSARQLSFHAHRASTCEIYGPEQPVADWAFHNRRAAGKFSENRPEVDTHFIPLMAGENILGVIGLRFEQSSAPNLQQGNLLEAFGQHIALALDRYRLREEAEQTKLLAESERLSQTLLNSMSHEIRTPLSVIQSATSGLMDLKEPELSSAQHDMISEIQEATERLNRLVGKVLDVTRIESGRVKPKLSLCDVGDLIHVALKETKKELMQHKVMVDIAPALPLVRADFVLLQQALMNLLSNASFHTPEGTAIKVSASVRDRSLLVSVADRGPGLPPEAIPRLFDKFFRAPGAPTGGTGLGLSLVKGFVEAQGGDVTAANRLGGGALFTIRLPLGQAAPG
jgi:two-component system sensor histidine kinase KdpD